MSFSKGFERCKEHCHRFADACRRLGQKLLALFDCEIGRYRYMALPRTISGKGEFQILDRGIAEKIPALDVRIRDGGNNVTVRRF